MKTFSSLKKLSAPKNQKSVLQKHGLSPKSSLLTYRHKNIYNHNNIIKTSTPALLNPQRNLGTFSKARQPISQSLAFPVKKNALQNETFLFYNRASPLIQKPNFSSPNLHLNTHKMLLTKPTISFGNRQFARKKKKSIGELKSPWYDSDSSSINSTFSLIEKSFGKGSVMKLDDHVQHKVPVISSGSIALDHALGTGGFPRGRIVEVYGPESSGKTTLALHVCAQAHKEGGKCAFIDAEHALDIEWAKKIGVKTGQMLLAQPDSGEQALDIVQLLIESGDMDVIVVDSVAALVPKAELEGDMGAHHIGTQARLMSLALRKIQPLLSANEKKTVMIFLNQIRMKVGTFGFGSPETTSGGS